MPQSYTDRVLYLERAGKMLKAAEMDLVKQAALLGGYVSQQAIDHYNAAVDQTLPAFKDFFEGSAGYLKTPGVLPQIPEYPVRFSVDEGAINGFGAADVLIPVSRITAVRPTLGAAYSVDSFAGYAAKMPSAYPDDVPALGSPIVMVVVIGVFVVLSLLAATWLMHEWKQPEVQAQLALAKQTDVVARQTAMVQAAWTKLAAECAARGSSTTDYATCMERGAGALTKISDSVIDDLPLAPATSPRRWPWIIVGLGLAALFVGGVVYYRRKRAQRDEPPAPAAAATEDDEVMDEVY